MTGVPRGRRLCRRRSPCGLLYGSLRGRVVTAARFRCPDAQCHHQPQDSGEAAGDHGRGGSGFPLSSGLGGETPWPDRAQGGSRVSGALLSGSLLALCLLAAGFGCGRIEPSPGPPEPLPEQRGQTQLRTAFLTPALEKAWLTRSVAPGGVDVKHFLPQK